MIDLQASRKESGETGGENVKDEYHRELGGWEGMAMMVQSNHNICRVLGWKGRRWKGRSKDCGGSRRL